MEMHKPVYRPPSVWVTQVLLVLALISSVVGLKTTLFLCSSAEPSFSFSCSSPFAINALLSHFLALAITFLAFWGLQKRKRYGKWLAVSLLVVGMVAVIIESHFLKLIYHSITQWQPLPAPPYECWEKEFEWSFRYSCGYRSHQELLSRFISEVFTPLILGFLAARLLCSEAAKRFFQ
jgi:uncharacterized membrane protein